MTDSFSGHMPRRRTRLTILSLGILALLLVIAFVALGTWQVERRIWKHDLIARVDARVHAAATAAPTASEFAALLPRDAEYRHVTVTGRFLHDRESLVYAATELGAGYWVITPLQVADGTVVLVNRGFVPTERRAPQTRLEGQGSGEATVTGLLRLDEPRGSVLRNNVPAEDRWYSRDVAAIAASHQLAGVRPYFIDADDTANPGGLPVGGLTRIIFPDNHLVYAITWYSLAILLAGGLAYAVRSEIRARRT